MNTTIIPSGHVRGHSAHAASCAERLGYRLMLALVAACVAGVMAGSAAGAGLGVPTRVQATQELVVLVTAHGAHRAPEPGSPQVKFLAARRPITGEETTLPVLSRTIRPGGAQWLQVMLPGRPNGSTGWITQQGTRPLLTSWHIMADRTV